MLIRELETQTGLERATIRYYEAEGLIFPERRDNGYRIYSEADRNTLLKIKLLRQLGISLERIKQLQQGSGDFNETLARQIEALEHQITESRRAADICAQIKSSGTSYENLDADYYLKEMAKEETQQTVPEFHRRQLLHPWKRFFSRWFDFVLLNTLVYFFLAVVLRIRPAIGGVYEILSWEIITHLLLIPVEAVLLHYFGTTPGKFMFGMRVESYNGGNPDIREGLRRGWAVLQYGYGFTIPIYSLWRLYKSYKDSDKRGYTDWDYESNTEVRFEYYFDTRKKLAIVGYVLLYLLSFGLTLNDMFRPAHRGSDLTVAQIAQNYNDWLDFSNEGKTTYDHITSEGLWLGNLSGGTMIYLSGTPKDGESEFVYEESGGVVRTITYEETWTDVFMLQPMGGRILNMTLTVASAQDWFGIIPMATFMQDLEKQFAQEQGEVHHENLVITWSVTSENCHQDSRGVYFADKTGQSKVTVQFQIQILEDN